MTYKDTNEMANRMYEIKDEIKKLEKQLAHKLDNDILNQIKELEIEYSYLEVDMNRLGYDTSRI